MEFPGDEETYAVSDQFMVGGSLLAAPVYERKTERKLLYLPHENGEDVSWLNWWTGEYFSSGYHVVDAPLEEMPLFIREGKGVPFTEPVQHTENLPDVLKLRVNTGRDGESKVNIPIYHDNGKTRSFDKGEHFFGSFVLDGAEGNLELETKNDGYPPFWDEVKVV